MRLKQIVLPFMAAFCAATISAQEIDWSANYATGKPIVGRFTSIDYNKVVDGNTATAFNDNPPANEIENWVIIDLGQARDITNVGVQNGTDGGRWPAKISVYAIEGDGAGFDMNAYATKNRVEKEGDSYVRVNNIFTVKDTPFTLAADYTKPNNNEGEGRFDNIALENTLTARYVALYFGEVHYGSNIAEVYVVNASAGDPVLTSMTVTPSNQLFYEDLSNISLDIVGLDQFNRPMELTGLSYKTEGMRRHDDGSFSMLDGYNRGTVTVNCGDLSETFGFARAHADRYLFGNAEINAAIAAGVTNSVSDAGTPANMLNITPTDPATKGSGQYKLLPDKSDRNTAVDVILPLPTKANIDGLSLIWSGGYPADYTVSFSTDGEKYTQVAEVTNHASIAGGGSAADMFYTHTPDVKYIKISVTRLGTDYGLELQNVKAYGSWELGDRMPASIVLTPEKNSVYLGESVKIAALVKDQFNERIENPVIEFSTNNGKISEDGVLAPAGTGEAVITAKVVSGADLLEATASVMVNNAPEASGIHANASATVFAGDVKSATINPVVVDQYGDPMENASEITVKAGEGVNIADDGTITLAKGAKSGYVILTAGDIEQTVRFAALDENSYLFDDDKYTDIKKNTAAHISWSGSASGTASTLIDGNEKTDPEADGSHGQLFVMASGSQDYDVEAEVLVPFYDPANLDVVALMWEGAYPADYTVAVTTDYESWTEVGTVTDREKIPAGAYGTDLFAVCLEGVRAMKVNVTRAGSGYGVKLADVKAYGSYVPAEPGRLELDPYVLVTYHDKDYTHPTTVAFHKVEADEENQITGYDAETVYLRPVLLDKLHEAPMVPHSAYSVKVLLDGEAAPEANYTLDVNAMTISFDVPGTYTVEASYTENGTTVTGSREIVTVHHNKMVTNTHASVYIYNDGQQLGLEDCPKNAWLEPSLLMEGRTNEEGGVKGSLMVGNYDIVVDFGKVLEIPAVEVYWEGACAVGYDVIFAQTEDELKERFAAQKYHWSLQSDRRAEIDRPRLDRIAVNVTENATKNQPANAAAADANSKVDPASPRAIRYVLLTNIAPDPNQVWTPEAPQKWDAKLSEITPYYDPEVVDDEDLVPTGIETVVSTPDAPVEYFTLQGIRVSNPASGSIVIRRHGAVVEKVVIR